MWYLNLFGANFITWNVQWPSIHKLVHFGLCYISISKHSLAYSVLIFIVFSIIALLCSSVQAFSLADIFHIFAITLYFHILTMSFIWLNIHNKVTALSHLVVFAYLLCGIFDCVTGVWCAMSGSTVCYYYHNVNVYFMHYFMIDGSTVVNLRHVA